MFCYGWQRSSWWGVVDMMAGRGGDVSVMFECKDFLTSFRKTHGFFSLVVDLGFFEWCVRHLSRLFYLNRKGVWGLRAISSVTGLRTISGGVASFGIRLFSRLFKLVHTIVVGFLRSQSLEVW